MGGRGGDEAEGEDAGEGARGCLKSGHDNNELIFSCLFR
jgi:hypothetical protein